MAVSAYPDTPLVEDFKGGDTLAVLRQMKEVHYSHPERVREFVFDAALAVGAGSCVHDDPPKALPRGLTRDQGVAAAKEHPGLCGFYLAGVSYDDVVATAERRGVSVTFNVFRNQCCFDAAKKLRADGMGVQLARKECFTQAFRAVFPGNGTPDQWVETTFSAENA
ncbi:unnamed protein product [Ectocarpus sp. CCAP 1310/34]|nr:unnamed protein product [Ectocarpus sp. CCAP 1310/34]